jgi:dipeptidase D
MKVIEGLAPANLWNRFYEICQIPRPSKHEERIRLYLRNFAGHNNLDFKEDRVGNIIIKIPPKPGFEKAPVVVIQNHVDMVCEKNKNTIHDFNNDPIKLLIDGDWIKAEGTTLGADNGIGTAAALALVNDDNFNHGEIELLFTVDEETGLTGANHLEPQFISGKYLLNLDSEEDGIFYIGCAGAMDVIGTLNIDYQLVDEAWNSYTIFISGLKGGHSGLNIGDKRANAVKLLSLLLNKLKGVDYYIGAISGGSKRNAIAREAEALIYIRSEDEVVLREHINAFSLESVLEFKGSDGEIKITFEKSKSDTSGKVFAKEFADKMINVILGLPHGVISMSRDIPGLVETSTNLATVVMENDEIRIGTNQRSSIESAKRNIAASVKSVFDLADATVAVNEGYPGWQPNLNSRLLKLSRKVHKELFGKVPELKAIHAGLECGILGSKYPWLEMVSFGPTIQGAHSPDERVKIHDVERFYTLLKAILVEISKIK